MALTGFAKVVGQVEFPDKDLDKIDLARHEFVRKYGAHGLATDVDYLISAVRQLRKREREDGFLDTDNKQIIAAFKHMCIRDHKHDPKHCGQCRLAEDTVKAVRGGEI